MKMGSVKIDDKEVRDIIRKCLCKAEHLNDPTRPYEIIAKAFADKFCEKNNKFNHRLFTRRCATDFKGDEIFIHN